MAVAPPMFTDRRLPFARNIYYHGVDTRQSPSMALPDPAWPSTHSNPRPSSAYPDDVPTQLSSWILSPPPPSSSSSWSTDSTFPPSLYSQPSKNTDHYQPGYAGSDSASSYASEYPESSQRTDLAHAISPPSLSASPYTSPYSSSHATIHRASSKYSLGNAIYTLDQDIHTSSSSPPPPPPPARSAPRPHRPARRSPAVKIEQEDPPHDPFVHETAPAQSSAHPHAQTESQVPLRATQASTEMRQMMGVFRLNPFATQGAFGGPAARASPAEEATALEEEGSVIEFQLELDGACAPRTPSPPPNGLLLRKLSPGVSPGASCYGGHGGSGVDRRGSPVGLQAQAQGGGGGMQGGGWGYELPSEIAAYPLLTASQSQAQAHSSLSMAHVAFGQALAEGGSSTGPSGEPAGAYQRYGHGHGHNHGHGHTHRTFDAGYVDDERSHINGTSHARARPAPPTYVDGHRRYGASPMTLPSRTTTGATGASAEYSEPYEYHDRYVSSATIPGSALAGMPSYSSSLSRRSIDHNTFYP